MSIENIDDLINCLQNIKKQFIAQGFAHPMDKDLLKKKLLDFYESEYYNIAAPAIKIEPMKDAIVHSNVSQPEVEAVVLKEASMPEIAVANVVSDKNDVAEPVLVNEVNRASVINEPAIHVVEEKFEPMNTSTMEIPKSGAAPTELNERLSSSVSSVNEKFQSNSNVADRLLSSKKSISELIDLNKRLLFVDVLFSGNNILFNQILEHIDEYRTAEEAIQFVEFNKAKLQVTDKKEPVYQSFLDVITKKYS